MDRLRRLLTLVFVIFLFFSLTKNVFDYQKSYRFYQGFKEDYEKEKKSNISLRTQVLKNRDPHEVEKTIRNKLSLLKKDELSIIIPSPTAAPQRPKQKLLAPYQQWLNVFFQIDN